VVAVITGVLMFASNAPSYAANLEFQLKLVTIVLAGVNMAIFHSTAHRRIADWDLDLPPPAAARISGFLSLALWTVVIVLGRWIGFTLAVVF